MTVEQNSSSNESYNDRSYYGCHRNDKSMMFLETSSWYTLSIKWLTLVPLVIHKLRFFPWLSSCPSTLTSRGNEHKIKVCLYILGDLSVCLSLTCFTVCTCTLLYDCTKYWLGNFGQNAKPLGDYKIPNSPFELDYMPNFLPWLLFVFFLGEVVDG